VIAGTTLEGTPAGTVLDAALRLVGVHKDPYLTVGTFLPNIQGHGNPLPLRQLGLGVHSWMIGQTGMGKSYHLMSQMRQLLAQGVGFSFIDPHDTGERFLAMLVSEGLFDNPANRRQVRYLDFQEDGSVCVPLNFLHRPGAQPATIAEQMLSVFHRLWPALGHGQAPRFDDIMQNGLLVLIANHLPITCMEQLLINRPFRLRLLGTMTADEYIDVQRFFRNRFESWGRNTPEYIDSTLTRISTLLAAPLLKYSLGQLGMALDFRQIMDAGTCVIYNLGRVQNENVRRFIGCLLTKGYENAAMSRQELEHWRRVPHHLYIDEFHDFSENSSDALSKTLTMGRKYGLFLTMAHQNWDQNSEQLQHAIETNAAVKKTFRVGRSDAEILARMFGVVTDKVKHEVSDDAAAERTHPVYYQTGEQWEQWIERLMHLRRQHLLVKVGVSPAQEVVSVPVVLRPPNLETLERVKQAFLHDLQQPRHAISLIHFAIQPDGTISSQVQQRLRTQGTGVWPPVVRQPRVRLPWDSVGESN
jgi:hypothetical protein